MSGSTLDVAENIDNADDEENQLVQHILSLAKMPTAISSTTLTKLDLFKCGLSHLPTSLPDVFPQLEILFLFMNQFREMPAVVGACKNLSMISFKSNNIKTIHDDALAPQLRWLILTDNEIESIPSTIGRCVRLQKLMLAGNCLKTIPAEIQNCSNLELVRLASNRLLQPPIALLSLPNLAWVAFSDNPFLESVTSGDIADAPQVSVDAETIMAGDELGRGASGITRKVWLDDNGCKYAVAVKTYSSTITSDGNPIEERKASLAASALPCRSLVNVTGQTNCGSLVMEFLKNYQVLAGPPSLKSCSRDVYDDVMSLSYKEAQQFAKELMDALCRLHSIGLAHGDFYGHNVLFCRIDGDDVLVKLTDFGAAFFYEKESDYGALIERIEMRAFGHLVEEILAICETPSDGNCSLRAIADACLSESSSCVSFSHLCSLLMSANSK